MNAGLPDPEVDAGDAATVERRAHKARQRRRRTEERHAGVAEILSNLTMPPCDQGGAFGAVEDASAWRGGEPPIVDWSTMAVTCDPSTMAHDGNEAGFRGDTVGDSDPGTAYGKRYTDSKSVSGVGVAAGGGAGGNSGGVGSSGCGGNWVGGALEGSGATATCNNK